MSEPSKALHDRARGSLLGLATGDAVGTSVEFMPRGSFPPVTDMLGGGPFRLSAGQWTDDTSMALCLAKSLLECGGFDAGDQMQRYLLWFETGYLSSTGSCFDIGNTVSSALQRFRESGDPWAGSTHPRSAGNGSLMRLAPVVLYAFPDATVACELAASSSRTTHGAEECLDACRLFAGMLVRALRGEDKEEVLLGDSGGFEGEAAIVAIANGAHASKSEDEIRGSGYVVESLEAALWCFDKTESFEQAILQAANLGDDADTTAAICGQLAGAFYGVEAIPSRRLVEGQAHAGERRPVLVDDPAGEARTALQRARAGVVSTVDPVLPGDAALGGGPVVGVQHDQGGVDLARLLCADVLGRRRRARRERQAGGQIAAPQVRVGEQGVQPEAAVLGGRRRGQVFELEQLVHPAHVAHERAGVDVAELRKGGRLLVREQQHAGAGDGFAVLVLHAPDGHGGHVGRARWGLDGNRFGRQGGGAGRGVGRRCRQVPRGDALPGRGGRLERIGEIVLQEEADEDTEDDQARRAHEGRERPVAIASSAAAGSLAHRLSPTR